MVMFPPAPVVGLRVMESATVPSTAGPGARREVSDHPAAGPKHFRPHRAGHHAMGAQLRPGLRRYDSTPVPRDSRRYATAADSFALGSVRRLAVGGNHGHRRLIRAEQRSFVEGHLQRALERGASLVGGGGRPRASTDTS